MAKKTNSQKKVDSREAKIDKFRRELEAVTDAELKERGLTRKQWNEEIKLFGEREIDLYA